MSKNIIVALENVVMFWTGCNRQIANTVVNEIIHQWDSAE